MRPTKDGFSSCWKNKKICNFAREKTSFYDKIDREILIAAKTSVRGNNNFQDGLLSTHV